MCFRWDDNRWIDAFPMESGMQSLIQDFELRSLIPIFTTITVAQIVLSG